MQGRPLQPPSTAPDILTTCRPPSPRVGRLGNGDDQIQRSTPTVGKGAKPRAAPAPTSSNRGVGWGSTAWEVGAGSRKQGGRSKDPRGGLGEKPVKSASPTRFQLQSWGGGGRMKGPNHPSPRSGVVEAKRKKDGLPERKGPLGHPRPPPLTR